MYLKVVNPRLETEVDKNDVVQAGIVISNSETGQGSVKVEPLVYRLVCLNGMIAQDMGQKKYHVGRGEELEADYTILSEETIRKDDEVFLMKIRDITKAVADMDIFSKVVDQMRKAKGLPINDKALPEVVELTAKRFNGIREEDRRNILEHLIRDSEMSIYGLGNAITRSSQDVEDYDHATELERIGHRVMTMPETMIREFAEVSTSAPKVIPTRQRRRQPVAA